MEELGYFYLVLSRPAALEDVRFEGGNKVHKGLEVLPMFGYKLSCSEVEHFESDVLLISDGVEDLGEDSHEEPDLVPEFNAAQQLLVEVILSESLQFSADHQLHLLPVLMVLLEYDVPREPGLEE